MRCNVTKSFSHPPLIDDFSLGEATFEKYRKLLPEVHYVVYVVPYRPFCLGELVPPVMLFVAHVHEAVVVPEAVGEEGRLRRDFPRYRGEDFACGAVFYDLGIDLPATLFGAEDDGFSGRAPAPFSPVPPDSEVALVDFDFAAFEEAFVFAGFGHS